MTDLKLISTAPRDGTKIVLFHKDYDALPIGWWDVVEGPSEEENGATWFLEDEDGGTMGDGVLWPDEDIMPTHWMPRPRLSDG